MGNPLNNFKRRFMDFLYKGAIAGNPEWYNQAVGMGSSIDEKQNPMSPEAANAADKVKEVGMLGAYEVAPVVTGLVGATKGAVDASKNGLNWRNGLEIGLNLLPGAIKGSRAALRNPNIVGKAEPSPTQLHVVGHPEKVVNTEDPALLEKIQEKFAAEYDEPVTWFKEGMPYDGGGMYQVRVIGTKPLGPTAKTMSGLMDSVIGQKYVGQDWTAYAKATDGVKKGGTLLYIPENQALVNNRIGGFAETNGNRFVETPVTHKWLNKEKFLGTEVHEGVSHPTDDAVAALTKDGKRVDDLYRELSNPVGVGEEANALGLLESPNSPNWVEARATRWEIAQKMLMDEAKSRGISVEALVKEDPMIMQKLANKVGPNELNDLLINVGTKYGVDYSTYLNLMPTKRAQAVYAGKWREALKWLPSVAAVPMIAPIMKKESTE